MGASLAIQLVAIYGTIVVLFFLVAFIGLAQNAEPTLRQCPKCGTPLYMPPFTPGTCSTCGSFVLFV